MSEKRTKKLLNVAFKQVQRLPDWRDVKVGSARPLCRESGARKSEVTVQPSDRSAHAR
jgi:hypothetical protein